MKVAGCGETIAVRKGEDQDWSALDRVLKKAIPGLTGEPQISQYAGGRSNLTFRLTYPGDDLVVRRPPLGTKAKTAHSMIREFRIMSTLRPHYPWVPETLYYSDDESVIGAEFYVMRKVEGRIVRLEIPHEWHFGAADTRRLCVNFWKKLIELHRVDYRAAGLADFGEPRGYAGRQVLGWNGRFERAMTPDVDDFSDVRAWLAAHVPPDSHRASILHGDYRIDNVVLSADDPGSIVAVLDWEICAIGDPLMDLGNALAYWTRPDDPEGLKCLVVQPSMADGMLSRAEILDLYARETGVDTSDFGFYAAYGYWRNAVIGQQIYYRYFHGQTEDRRFAAFGTIAQNLGEHCRRLIALSPGSAAPS